MRVDCRWECSACGIQVRKVREVRNVRMVRSCAPCAPHAPYAPHLPFAPVLMPSELTIPGLCDLQVNGFAGVDFNDTATGADAVARAAAAVEATGVTSFLPTLISSDLARFAVCARTVLSSGAGGILGLHMEGPYLAPGDGPRGAHDPVAMTAASVDD